MLFSEWQGYYLSRRVEKGTWEMFIADLEENFQLSIDAKDLAM